ncbi:MAG: hypothetical protein IT362_01630 [Deltaproteobacteria bacterium]|nr:hypothetical protein [Deltaproteobacteria bacterium]
MKSTWASSAIELLEHANSHILTNTDFDKRMAFISIDNSIEVMVRTFLSMPKIISGISVDTKALKEAQNIFPRLLELLYKHASSKIIGIDVTEIEFYHRIRNKLYHDGLGITVCKQHLDAYKGIASVLLQNLFNETIPIAPENFSMEKLIVNWNIIENLIKKEIERQGLVISYSRIENFNAPSLNKEISELRKIRNKFVHSEKIEDADVRFWAQRSEDLLQKLKYIRDQATATDTVNVSRVCAHCGSSLIKEKNNIFVCPKCSR